MLSLIITVCTSHPVHPGAKLLQQISPLQNAKSDYFVEMWLSEVLPIYTEPLGSCTVLQVLQSLVRMASWELEAGHEMTFPASVSQ